MALFISTSILIWSVLYGTGIISCNNSEELHLKCVQGEMEGKFLTTRGGREIRAFMSIPYAEPPIGKLRFQAPVPMTTWEGVLDAKRIHDVCIQKDSLTKNVVVEGVEDCLYLNVYAPKKSEIKHPLPVMMFLHGGGFFAGTGNINSFGPGILLDKDIILVIPNYRLGALGFISTGDDVFPGNNGLKDQNLALKWITKNIDKFGGDPNKITIFGESAGAGATHLHMISPMSRDMFQRGISQSGSGLALWAIAPAEEAKEHAHKLATLLECPITSSQAMLECLQKVKPYRIVDLDNHFMQWSYDPLVPFKPVVEHNHPGAFLTEHPAEIVKSGKMPKTPWMVGVTADEGAIKVASLLEHQDRVAQLNDDFDRIIPISIGYKKHMKDVAGVTKRIKELYFKGNQKIGRETKQNLIDMFTDGWFFNGTDIAVNMHRQYVKNNIFFYKLAHRGVHSFSEFFGDPSINYGVCHGDELQYLFPIPFPGEGPNEADQKMSKHITTLWTNFAKNGVPTIQNEDELVPQWSPVKTDRLEYYHLEIPEKSYMTKDMFIERAKVWRTLNDNNFSKEEL